ncbi:MAG: serine racemase VanT catalytic subunit [Erysipelotrichaceae bacterium]|nr:serine racemase VanT catalytic subunit [Erysipelotrichaceae bacterium]
MIMHNRHHSIDNFRLLAACLVIAIHISPLAVISPTSDLILTRIIGRLAVPFFFMVSGYFVLSHYDNNDRVTRFLKKSFHLYVIGMCLYLPVMIYSHGIQSLPALIQDIVMDGTFYHLWYFPASMIGIIISYYLIRRLDYQYAIPIALLLYVIGLGGDSYYGLMQQLPLCRHFYESLFQVMDYTRNGLFMAPVFFVMGSYLKDNQPQKTHNGALLICAIGLMIEALLLHHFHIPRHDSMYIFLLPVMYYGFMALLECKSKEIKQASTLAMIVYMIHPLMIILVRGVAKVSRVPWLVTNPLIHYLVVCSLSFIIAGVIIQIKERLYQTTSKTPLYTDRAYIELNLSHLTHNVNVIQKAMHDDCEMMAVVKANAYGHGALPIATHLDRLGVRSYAVATIDEGIELRQHGIHGEILILGYTDVHRARELKRYQLTQTLIDENYAHALNDEGIPVKAHLKIDTGMHRLGIDYKDIDAILSMFQLPHITIDGILTHFSSSDSLDDEDVYFTRMQKARFDSVIHAIKEANIPLPKVHCQSSYGFLNYPEFHYDYIRAGIILQGVTSTPHEKTVLSLDLKPVLSIKSHIALIRELDIGEPIGYSRTYITTKKTTIAIIPMGYADGLPRNQSNMVGHVLINEQLCPIVGRICMDQLMVDITDVDASINDEVIFIDMDEETVRAENVAERSHTISNELLSRLGHRLPVVISN